MKKFTFLLLACFSISILQGQKNISVSEAEAPVNQYHKVNIQLSSGFTAGEVVSALHQQFPALEEMGCAVQDFHQIESPGGYHYSFYQIFDGRPVTGSMFKVNITKSGRIISIVGNPVTVVPQKIGTFAHSTTAVEQFITDHIRPQSAIFEIKISEAWLPETGGLRAVYFAETYSGDPDASLELIIDAENLTILSSKDRSVYHTHTAGPDTTGLGLVWIPDPVTSAQTTYSGNYRDLSDGDNASLNGERDTVTLKGLTYSGAFKLEGPFVKVAEIESPVVVPVTSANGEFFYTRSQSGFEDVMVYYHIDTFQRYIQSLGFNNLGNQQLSVDPHALNGADNSHFVPSGTSGHLGFGEGGVDDAEDMDVILHEYGHFLSNNVSPGTNSGFERNGLDEGFGDYIAASWSRRISNYAWDDVFNWDGHNEFWSGRDASHPDNYPPSQSWNFYAFGEVWATVLMMAWPDVGQEVSDRNFFQELYMNSSNMTLNDAAHLILDADTLLYGGAHTGIYVGHFCSKNIFTGAECLVSVDGNAAEKGSIEIWPNPSRGVVNISWFRDAAELELTDLSGKALGKIKVSPGVNRVEPDVPPGIYFLGWTDIQSGKKLVGKLVIAE